MSGENGADVASCDRRSDARDNFGGSMNGNPRVEDYHKAGGCPGGGDDGDGDNHRSHS